VLSVAFIVHRKHKDGFVPTIIKFFENVNREASSDTGYPARLSNGKFRFRLELDVYRTYGGV